MSNKISTFLDSKNRTRSGASNAQYKEAAKSLRKFHKFGFDLRGNLSANQKRSISIQAKKLKTFVDDIEEGKRRRAKGATLGQRTQFVKFKTVAERKEAERILGKNAVTNKGMLIKTPNLSKTINAKGAFKDGGIEVITGKQRRLILPIENVSDFLDDPDYEIGKLISRHGMPVSISFTMNGYAISGNYAPEDLDLFFLADSFLDNAEGISDAINGVIFYYYET